MILMEHPSHGKTHAYTAAQVADNKANGWKICEEAIEKIDITALRRRYKAKFGKKPYHGKGVKELLRDLAK